MKPKTWIGILALVTVIGGGIGVWKVQENRAHAAAVESQIIRELSEEQIVLLLQNQQLVEPSKTLSVVETAETRKAFLRGLREYMALAARARREGIADEPNIKRILNYKEDTLLFSLYLNKLDNEKGSYFEVPKDQIDAYLAAPAHTAEFDAEMAAIKDVQRSVSKNTGNPLPAPPTADGEAAVKNKENWAKAKILSDMACSDTAFMENPAIQLRLKVAEAGTLATNYLNKHWAERIRVTDQEITNYLKGHPEYAPNVKKDLATKVLTRVKSGEDFDALAKEFSEDRTNKSQGGVYKDVRPGFLWPEVEQAALGLQPGQVADGLVESKDGWHVVGLVKRSMTKAADGTETPVMDVRHILIQKKFEEPGERKADIPPPFLTPREIAEAAVRKEKRQKFVDEIVASEKIVLPEDFQYEITDELRNSGTRIENKLDEIEAEEKEELKKQRLSK